MVLHIGIPAGFRSLGSAFLFVSDLGRNFVQVQLLCCRVHVSCNLMAILQCAPGRIFDRLQNKVHLSQYFKVNVAILSGCA